MMRHSTSMILLSLAAASCTPKSVTPTATPPVAAPPVVPAVAEKPPVSTFAGTVVYEDGSPAAGALIAVTALPRGNSVALLTAQPDGRFATALDAGEYSLAITTEQGFGFVEPFQLPNVDATLTLSRACKPLHGRVKGAAADVQASLGRLSPHTGDGFVANLRPDGTFTLCLPEGHYFAEARGAAVSLERTVDLLGEQRDARHLELEALPTDLVKQPPRDVVQVRAGLDDLVADILRRDARLVGMGEATHGNLELTTSRAALTFELIRRADLRLVLFEFDAILGTAIDDYVMGRDIDLPKAVAALGFWITDTYELLQFFEDLRAYNASTRNKVRVWGMDVQDTNPPVALLLAHARTLKLTADDKALLEAIAARRGRPVLDLPSARRAALDALLARLAKRPTQNDLDLRIAVAARSLQVQVGYFQGDVGGLYGARRDAGMAALSSFLVTQAGVRRAAVWAHAGHVARHLQGGRLVMGSHLARIDALRYYPIGIFIHEGSVRAWDAAGAIGVISHRISPAADYMLEGAVMAATGTPDIAWLPVSAFSPALREWATVPRYVREVGAVFRDEESMLSLRDIPREFDAVAVIKTGRDSSPTPTGIRRVDK